METIKQKIETLRIENGGTIEVRRMRWKDARIFLRTLAGVIQPLYAEALAAAKAARTAGDAAQGDAPLESFGASIMSKLPQIIAASDELATLLCVASTGKKADEIDELDALTVSEILRVALSINCDDELKNSWAGIVRSVAGLLPANRTTS